MDTILAVDLGGTKVLVGEIDEGGQILNELKVESNVESQNKSVLTIIEAIQEYLDNQVVGSIKGISVSVVGRVNSSTGIWYEINPDVSSPLRLPEIIEQKFKLPCVINNDVFSATFAELVKGAGKGNKDFIYINVGTGIAARVVSDGKIVIGSHFNAGEAGHMVVDMTSKEQCICGRFGCVESFASGSGMSQAVQAKIEHYPDSILNRCAKEKISFQEIIAAYKKGDSLAFDVVSKASNGIAQLIMNLVRVSDPTIVILGGGVISENLFFELIKSRLNHETMRFVINGVVQTTFNSSTVALVGTGLFGFNVLKKENI